MGTAHASPLQELGGSSATLADPTVESILSLYSRQMLDRGLQHTCAGGFRIRVYVTCWLFLLSLLRRVPSHRSSLSTLWPVSAHLVCTGDNLTGQLSSSSLERRDAFRCRIVVRSVPWRQVSVAVVTKARVTSLLEFLGALCVCVGAWIRTLLTPCLVWGEPPQLVQCFEPLSDIEEYGLELSESTVNLPDHSLSAAAREDPEKSP